ncbi:DNA annealing helicase and endonuclease ZRANB3-like [Ostrea edulis]|uniref:DNA annealing helicase and endonuclease ZRANB3-like n=1 Tax=Ostrea edulis TaxID=37623 RepID=UPI0024AF6E0B|nr:DNA annealing helicase and endonuclease ZRANB3-like [Ostrea edulis]
MRKADSLEFLKNLPYKLVEQLMPFQRDGIRYALEKNGRCLIADEMGLGKTLQALSVAYIYKAEWPLLIIVPSSLRFCWVEEIEKWFPDTSPEDIFMVQTGNNASGIQNRKIVITTYGLLSKTTSKVVLEALTNQSFQVVIVDESHYIRNIKTASCKAISPLIRSANRRILLSGTPSLSKPVELFSQIDAICPNTFGSWWTYTAHFCDARIQYIGKIRKRNVDGASNLEELQKKLKDVLMIRRMKDDVLTQLPAKQRQQILFQLKDSPVTKSIEKTFHELKSSMKKDHCQVDNVYRMATSDGFSGNTLSLIQKLYQLSGEAKIGAAREYVAMLCDSKNLKFLVFAYHHAMMNGLQQTLMDHNVKFIRIDGDTKPSDRQLYVQQFQSDPDTRVAILSILAAGVGLTFTKATLVVFAEMYWTPGVLIQCEDRAHRIGQTSCVSVHYLVAKDTMDEWVWSAVCRKTIVTTTTLNGQKQVMQADKGNKYQVDLLSTADVYKAPSAEEAANTDFAAIFSSQKSKDQTSILDFIDSGKKRKRKDGFSVSKGEKLLDSRSDSEDIVEISDSDDEKKSYSQGSSMKKMRKTNCKKKRLFWTREENDEENDFVSEKPKLTRQTSQIKQTHSLIDNWGCARCTFQNHADLPCCEICNTPKHKKSKTLISTQELPDPKVNDNHTEQQGEFGVLKCDDDSCITESNSELSKSPGLYSTVCLVDSRSVTKDMFSDQKDKKINICDHSEGEGFSEEKCVERNPSSKSDQKQRRSFFLETYSPVNADVDQSSHSSQNSTSSDQFSASVQTSQDKDVMVESSRNMNQEMTCSEDTTSSGQETIDDQEVTSSGQETIDDQEVTSSGQEMIDDQEVTSSGQETVDDQGIEDSLQPTPSDKMKQDVCDITKEIHDDEWDQNAVSQGVTKIEDTVIVKDTSAIPVYKSFYYKCSAYTNRIYLYNENGDSLQANFMPLDVEMNNQGNLPDILLLPQNFRLVQKFMREWNSLTETKRRLIVKSTKLFDSPLDAYEALKSDRSTTTIRHKTKEDIATESLAKADEVQGDIRVVKRSYHSETSLLQATTSDGIPICLNCSKPCDNRLLKKETLKSVETAWATRFCSQICMDKYWIQTNSSYCRDQVYEAEHGICQMCNFDAHSLYKQIRNTEDMQRRVDILHSSKFDKLNPKQKEKIVKNPAAGQFWHVDHIRPVWEGGGQCDIDNFRTLCVLCHQKLTAQQARKRATIRKLGVATGMADITAFFQPIGN